MRNFIVRAYHEVDLRVIWTTATQEVPALRTAVETVLKNFSDQK